MLVAGRRLPFRDRLRSLPEAVDEVLVVLPRTTERVVGAIYTSISCFRVSSLSIHGCTAETVQALRR